MDTRAFIAIFLAVHTALAFLVPTSDVREIAHAVYLQALLLVWLLLLGSLILFLQVARKRMLRPTHVMFRIARRHRARFCEGAVFLVALSLMMQIYMVLKVSIPSLVPFFADPFLADFDAILFGQDPWRISHAWLGAGATRFLDMFYVMPCVIVSLGMTIWVCFSKDRAFSKRSVLAIIMCWFIIGVWAALALSSAGPIYVEHFYGDPRFVGLQSALPSDLTATRTQAYLLENFGAPGFGKGISAMPSMHNAIYLLLVWMIHDRFGNSWQLWSAIAFEATVFVASVHLGWHYALDGLIAAIMVPPIWYFAGRVETISLPVLNVAKSKSRAGHPA